MWLETIPRPSKGSYNELGLYIYHHPKKKKKRTTTEISLHKHLHKIQRKEREREREIEQIYKATRRSEAINRDKEKKLNQRESDRWKEG